MGIWVKIEKWGGSPPRSLTSTWKEEMTVGLLTSSLTRLSVMTGAVFILEVQMNVLY